MLHDLVLAYIINEYVLPAALIIILVAVCALYEVHKSRTWKRKKSLLEACGFVRELYGASSYGGKACYQWINHENGQTILESKVWELSYKDIKHIALRK